MAANKEGEMRKNFRILGMAGVLFAAITAVTPAIAQDWPTRPIKLLVGFGPGGGTDIAARIVADGLTEVLGQPVVVENKPGASATIAADMVAKGPKDGYTALLISSVHVWSAVLYKKISYDPVNDFQMISLIGNAAYVLLAHPDFPAKTLQEAITLIKASPGKYNYASNGVGTGQHFAIELMSQMTGTKLVHSPYRSTPEAIGALQGKHVDLLLDLIQTVQGPLEAGTLKPLGVTSLDRFPALPNSPTFAESGLPGYAVTSWYGLALPAGVPAAVVDRMTKAMQQVMANPKIQQQITKAGALPASSTPDELTKFVSSEISKWRETREKVGIPLQ